MSHRCHFARPSVIDTKMLLLELRNYMARMLLLVALLLLKMRAILTLIRMMWLGTIAVIVATSMTS